MQRNRTGIRGLGVAVAAATALAGLAGCSSSAPPALHAAGGDLTPSPDHVAGGNVFTSTRGSKVSVQLQIPVCTRTSSISVTAVTLHNPSPGLVLGHWGIANDPPGGYGEADGPLFKLGGVYESRRVTTHCYHGEDWAYIAVELTRTSAAPARTMGFDVHYTQGGNSRVLWLGYTTMLARTLSHP